MKTFSFRSVAAAVLAVVGWVATDFWLVGACVAASDDPPNVILIMADDLGWGDTGYYGHPFIQTPHLDQMASDGVRFDRFYAGAPVCSPTRGSVLTGRHPFRYGVNHANKGHMKREEVTLAEVMKANGYRTGHFGKWHLGTLTNTVQESNRGGRAPQHYAPPWDHGFDVCFSTEAKTPTWWNEGDYQRYGTHYWTGADQKVPGDSIIGDDSRIIMNPAIEFIRSSVEEQRPFFAIVWFHAPHKPIVAGEKYLEQYRDIPDFAPNKPESAAHYYGCITAMDEQIGRLRSTLKRLGVEGNTLIGFCSDNGPENRTAGRAAAKLPSSEEAVLTRLSGRKRSLKEGGIRVPGLMVWPKKIKPGLVTNIPCVTSDYFPTILSASRIQTDSKRPSDGIDLLPILLGEQVERPSRIGFQSGNQKAWIGNRYKAFSQQGQWALYDLTVDPSESKDLSGEHPERLRRMQAEFQQWAKDCELSSTGDDYKR